MGTHRLEGRVSNAGGATSTLQQSLAAGPSPLADVGVQAVSFTISGDSGDEGDDLTFRITIHNPNYAVTPDYVVYYRAWDITAEGGEDYEGVPNYVAVHFTANSGSTFEIDLRTYVDADSNEGTEEFEVDLYDYQFYYLGNAVGRIHDTPPVEFTISGDETTEGGRLRFEITIENPNFDVTSDYVVYYRTWDISADGGIDYEGVPNLVAVHFTENSDRSVWVTLDTYADADSDEGTEEFSIALYDYAQAYLGEAIGTIRDAPPVEFSVSDVTVTEGGEMDFRIRIENPNYEVTPEYLVYYRTWDFTAQGGVDYEGVPQLVPVYFSQNTGDSVVVRLSTYNDANADEGIERFDFVIYDNDENELDSATGYIEDRPPVEFVVTNGSATEGSPLSFLITIVNPNFDVTSDYVVYYRTQDGSARGGIDYEGVPNYVPIHFTEGSSSTVEVLLDSYRDDNSGEGNETFSFQIFDNNQVLLDQSTGTIIDTPPVTISVSDAEAAEGGQLNFQIAIDNPDWATNPEYIVYYRTFDGSAKGGLDYEGVPALQSMIHASLRSPSGSSSTTTSSSP